jgi:lipopolysaccharide transport system permease protein
MNPHANHSFSPAFIVDSIRRHHQLITQMAWREVIGRYQGSLLGLAWSFFNPVLMLLVYTFVFSVIFKARWALGTEGNVDYALILFVGLIAHGFFSEVINRSPGLILSNANYVKKVVFPLEVLPVIALLSALFHALVNAVVLLVAFVVIGKPLLWTALLFPLVFAPLAVLALGLSWGLASLGVFVRDVSQTVGIITMLLMFLAPVVYPVSAVPERLRPLLMLNPLTFIIEQSRNVLIWGRLPDWMGLLLFLAISLSVAWLGFVWFQKTRKGFADVI